MRALIIALGLVALAQSSEAFAAGIDAKLKKAVEQSVGELLNDPYSAKYTHDRVSMRSQTVGTVCGTVNAKNAFGAYVGKRPFTAIFIRTTTGEYLMDPKIWDQGTTLADLASICGGSK